MLYKNWFEKSQGQASPKFGFGFGFANVIFLGAVFAATCAAPFAAVATDSAKLKSAGVTTYKVIKAKSEKSTAKNSSYQIVYSIKPGFHFNPDAPAQIIGAKFQAPPESIAKEQLIFAVAEQQAGTGQQSGSSVKAQYYVCDDDNTVCESHEDQLDLANYTIAAYSAKATVAKAEPVKVSATAESESPFIVDDLNRAIKEARKKDKLVFVEFGASWCPPCMRLVSEVFPAPEFLLAATPNYVLAKLDVDKPKNYAALKKYAIRAYPTLLILDKNGEELQRVLDFLPAAALAKVLTDTATERPQNLAKLRKAANALAKAKDGAKNNGIDNTNTKNRQAALQLAEHHFKSLQYGEANKYYKLAGSNSISAFQSQIYAWEEKRDSSEAAEGLAAADRTKYSESLQAAIAAFPESFYSLQWRMSLAELQNEAKQQGEFQKTLDEALALAKRWVQEPELIAKAHEQGELLEMQGLVIPEAYAAQAQIYESLKQEDKATAAWNAAVDETLKLAPDENNPNLVIYLVAYMKKTKELTEIEPWLVKLQKRYPKEFTFYYRQAHLLFDKKEFARALPIATQAYDLSYGSNRLSTGLLLSKVYKEQGDLKQAKSLLKELISSPVAKDKKNGRLAKSLSKFQGTLAKEGATHASGAEKKTSDKKTQ